MPKPYKHFGDNKLLNCDWTSLLLITEAKIQKATYNHILYCTPTNSRWELWACLSLSLRVQSCAFKKAWHGYQPPALEQEHIQNEWLIENLLLNKENILLHGDASWETNTGIRLSVTHVKYPQSDMQSERQLSRARLKNKAKISCTLMI